ncbi:MAG: hypothetical protein RL141_787 [Candidatus Parcubacteria bacterium]|jgi:hypothetical protein
MHEYRLMHGRSRIAVAELYRFNDSNQSRGDHDFRERVVLRGYCLPLPKTGFARYADAVELNSRQGAHSPVSNRK